MQAPFLCPQAGAQTAVRDEREISRQDLINAVRAGRPQYVDTRARIVEMLLEVKEGRMSPEAFYQGVSKLEMPSGKEVRHTLMEVKKDIGNYLGQDGLRAVFGEVFASGATRVEAEILTHRKQVVFETIKQAIVAYRDKVFRATGEYPKFTFYYGEVGGWPGEKFEELKFAGDIDFNFLAGDLDAAMELKKIFDDLIKKRYGRTPEELDIPCTVHGMATAEVYVGKHGQSFAEEVTKVAWEIDFEKAGPDMDLKAKEVPFKEVLRNMVLEARVAEVSNSIDNLQELKWPYQPGISLEMIRHFEHDIAGQDVFTDLESFVKAAKYTDRAYSFLIKELGEGATFDPLLKKFVEKLTKWKKDPKAQVEFIKLYFESIGKPIPYDVNLEINEDGKGRATIEANERLIRDFWDTCRKAMWDGANQVLRKKTEDLKRRIAALGKDDIEDSKKIYEDLVKLDEMLEIEFRVLGDDVAGLHGGLDPDYVKLMDEFRTTRGEYKQKSAKFGHVEYIDPKLGKTYKWVEKMLSMGKPDNIKWAGAALFSTPGKLNDILDFLDDGLMNKLRYGEGADYIKILRKGQGLYWDEQANKFLKGTPFEGRFDAKLQSLEAEYGQKIKDIEQSLSKVFENRLTARGLKAIHTINNTFNESVSSSRGGKVMMNTMMLYNLKEELPIYIEKISRGDWAGFATEYFRRRTPVGGAIERYIMGDYYGVAWEATTVMIPPVAIASAAKSVGESVATSAIEFYLSEEMAIFIDNLYEDAEFAAGAVEEVGEGLKVTSWELKAVRYQGKEFDFRELLMTEVADAREMGACLKQPSAQRPACFPMEKMSNGLFEWWRNRDAFEQQFKRSDPWLQLIIEMKNHPDVGPKLEDHFRYMLYTRLEQVKVQFLQEVKKKLEERRAGEESLLSGQFQKMYEELLNITGDLDVRVQLEAKISEEFGGEVYQFLTWMYDRMRGVTREMRGEVDVWDVYEELSVFVTRNLGNYKKVLDARGEAEALLSLRRSDQGLRILTGPYFLTGDGAQDVAVAKKWSAYPVQAEKEMSSRMQAIKKEAGADPARLDLSEGAYDRGVLDQLIDHDTYREMWKHVNSRVLSVEVESYLGKDPARQEEPNAEGVMSDQDRALQRFRVHANRIDEILAEFRAHYKGSGEDGDGSSEEGGDESGGEPVQSLDALLAAIEALEAQAEGFKDQADNLADALRGTDRDISRAVNSLTEQVALLNAEADALRDAPLDRADPDTIGLYEKDVYSAGQRLGEIRSRISALTISVCEAYEQVKATNNVDRLDNIYGDMTAQLQEVDRLNTEYKRLVGQMKSLKQRAEQEAAKAGGVSPRLESAESRMGSLVTQASGIADQIGQMQAAVDQIRGVQGQVSALAQEAVTLVDQAHALPVESLERREKKLVKKIDRAMGKIRKDEAAVIADASRAEGYATGQQGALAGALTALKSIKAKLDERRAMATDPAVVRAVEQAMAQFNASYEAGMLFCESIEFAAQSAGTCMGATLPVYRERTSPEARVAQTDCSRWPGTRAEWDASQHKAICDCPGTDVYSNARNRCITLREHELSRLNCNQFPNSEPFWNEGTQQASCQCLSGYQPNRNRTACINPQREMARADCSGYGPYAETRWDAGSERAVCGCRAGYTWNSNQTRCMVPPAPQPAYDPYGNTGYDQGGYGNDQGSIWDDPNAMQQILEGFGGNQNSGSGQSNRSRCTGNEQYDRTIRGIYADGCGDGSTSQGSSSDSNCAYNYTMGSTGLYGGKTFTCNCPGWGFDPGRTRCVEGFSDRYSGRQQQPAPPPKRPTGITTNRSREQMGNRSAGGSTSTGGGNTNGEYQPLQCKDYPKDFCRWEGGTPTWGMPELGMSQLRCICGCYTESPASKCANMPKPPGY